MKIYKLATNLSDPKVPWTEGYSGEEQAQILHDKYLEKNEKQQRNLLIREVEAAFFRQHVYVRKFEYSLENDILSIMPTVDAQEQKRLQAKPEKLSQIEQDIKNWIAKNRYEEIRKIQIQIIIQILKAK